MKKMFTLALTVLSYTAFAHPNDGRLTVTNLSNQNVVIEIDGKADASRNGERYFLIPELTPGIHAIKLYTYDTDSRTASKSLMLKRKVFILQRSINVRSRYHVDITVNRFGRATVDEMFMNEVAYKNLDELGWYTGNDGYNNNGGYGNNGNNGGYNNGNGGYNNGNTGNGNNGGYNNGNNNNGSNGNNNNGGYGNNGNNNGQYGNNDPRYSDPRFRPMSDQSFANFKQALAKEYVDNSKVAIAKQVIEQNYFTADQVKQVVQLFNFDNYKLDIAKTAYKNTVNREEYFVIYEMFSFPSSKQDLATFIKNYK